MKKLIMGFGFTLFAVLLNAYDPTPAAAQSLISVSMNKSRLEWKWDQGVGGPVDFFNVKCGKESGVYTKTTVVVGTARSVPTSQAIDGYGQWFCAVTAVNSFDESGRSNEITFNAGDPPTNPFDFNVVGGS